MLKQSLQQRLLQKLSPQQIQLMKLLQLPTIELEQRIKDEIIDNPALEEGVENNIEVEDNQLDNDDYENQTEEFDFDDYYDADSSDYKMYANNHSQDDEQVGIPLASGDSMQEVLMDQLSLRLITEKDKIIGKEIIGNLDENGYLRREIDAIIDDLAFSQNLTSTEEDIERVLSVIQDMEPYGLGAADLQECLSIQIQKKLEIEDSEELHEAQLIIDVYFDEFTKKHYQKIEQKLEIDDDKLRKAIEIITHLNPKPGNVLKDNSQPTQQIIPDFILNDIDGNLELSLNSRNAPTLKVSKTYANMIQAYQESKNKDKNKGTIQFVKQKLDNAKWFIDAIKQRQNTLLITMDAILQYQKEYFATGDETKLKPMILKDIADKINMDISTVSRVANSKYIQTTFGTFLLKTFFNESIENDDGEEISTREIKAILKETINQENKRKPFTDDKLSSILKEKGYNIARRTVAKYREQLNIPVARLRKEL